MANQSMLLVITVLSGLLLTGCMQSVLLFDESGEPAEQSMEETERNQNTIQVKTTDGAVFTLSDWKRDSLGNIEGVGSRTPWPVKHPDITFKFSGRIGAESIQRISTKDFDVLATVLCAGVVALITIGLMILSSPIGGMGLSGEFGKALGGSSW